MSRRDILVLVGASVASAAAASAVTYFATRKILGDQYDVRLERELEETVRYLAEQQISLSNVLISNDEFETEEEVEEPVVDDGKDRVFPDADKPSLDDLARANATTAYHKVLEEVDYGPTEDLPPEPPSDPDISVISRDLFVSNTSDFEQASVTYFADGGVLDDEGNFIEEHVTLIGPGVPAFGEMSEDPDIVFVRNHRLKKEFEIIRDPQNASEFLAHELQTQYSDRV